MHRLALWFLLVSPLLVLSPACEKAPPEQEATVRVGLISYLKGEQRENVGLDTLVAANMAVEEINASGGVLIGERRIPLELLVEEIDTNAEQAVKATRNLINNRRVVVIIGPYFSGDAIPAGAVAEQSRVPMIAPVATHPEVTQGRHYVLRGTFLDSQQGKAIARFAREELKVSDAAVVFDESNPYSSGLAADFAGAFEDEQGRIVFSRGVVRDELLDDSLWKELVAKRPAALFLPLYSPASGEAADKARASGFSGIFLGSDAWDSRVDAKFESLQGAFMTSNFSRKLEMPATKDFVAEFERRRKREPGDSSALTYDTIKLIAKALEYKGAVGTEELLQGLMELPPYFGVAGSIDYVDSGNPVKAVVFNELHNGDALFRKFMVIGD